jgi:hypothetical protein
MQWLISKERILARAGILSRDRASSWKIAKTIHNSTDEDE